jgi:hypothetical protein
MNVHKIDPRSIVSTGPEVDHPNPGGLPETEVKKGGDGSKKDFRRKRK